MSMLLPLLASAWRHRHRIAVIDDRRQYSYAELLGGAFHLAEQIQARTAKPHVGIMLPTSGTFPLALLAVWLTGKVAVPLNYLLSPSELQYVVENSGIDLILTAQPLLDAIKRGDEPAFAPPGVELFRLEDADFTGVPPLRWPPLARSSDLAVILYTSGTSGRPKGVMLTHGNLQSDVAAAIVHSGITQADMFLGVLPQFHSFGLTALTLLPLTLGTTVVYSARFVPRHIVNLIRRHKPGVMMAVPSMYGALLSVKDAVAEDFASVRIAISGGEPLPEVVRDTFHQRFHVHLLEGYGLTETSPITHWSTPDRNRARSVGRALPGVIVGIVDDQDRPLPVGKDGEILLAGPMIMQGYYKLPDQTAATLATLTLNGQPHRFLRTGDIGRVDEQGYLYITGRKKEMLIVGGENVFPREIEEVLNQHPAVKDSAVVGKNDGMRGEVPVAFIELKDGAVFDDKDLRSFCRDRIAGYKVPREITVLESLPRNATGKILRRQLKA